MTKEEKRQRIIESWKATGYLDGLKAPSAENMQKLTNLFGSFESQVINENTIIPLAFKVAQESIDKEKNKQV